MGVSSDQFGCQAVVHQRRSKGIMGKGKESFTTVPGICGRSPAEGSDLCDKHVAAAAVMSDKLAKKKEWEAANPGQRWRG